LNKILENRKLSEQVVKMVFEAPVIAQKRKAGQFIILKIDEKGERIPLTIVDSDAQKGTVTIIYQIVGKTTAQLSQLKAGDVLQDVQGPLGNWACHLCRWRCRCGGGLSLGRGAEKSRE